MPKKKAFQLTPEEEKEAFKNIQYQFPRQFKKLFPGRLTPKSVVVIPSLTLDEEILSKVTGHNFYEERLLCLLLLLRMPLTHIVYVTSTPVDPIIIDYYLHQLPGVTRQHALERLTLLSCYDSSPKSLTEKILDRPRLVERIKKSIPKGHTAHLTCFNVTKFERTLSVRLKMPIYGCDPELYPLGDKSNGRKIFRKCGLNVANGFEDLRTKKDIVKALITLKHINPMLKKAVVKINEGFSGEGNAIYYYPEKFSGPTLDKAIKNSLDTHLKVVAQNLSVEGFLKKFSEMQGVVEEFLDAEVKASPSVQCRINPLGDCKVISTHDQLIGGESEQVYLGASFPANKEYSTDIAKMGLRVAEHLKSSGVTGRFSVDFLSLKIAGEWKHYAVEVNIRKGGTTHPYILIELLTDGDYYCETGDFRTKYGTSRYYFCSDNLYSEKYKGLTPHDLIDIAMLYGLHYNSTTQEGVMFHLIGALSQYGKLGVVCIGSSHERAKKFYHDTVKVLNNACR